MEVNFLCRILSSG